MDEGQRLIGHKEARICSWTNILISIPILLLSISCIIVGSTQYNKSCGNQIIEFQHWLFIYSITLISFYVYSIIIIRIKMDLCSNLNIIYCSIWLFAFVWNIIGAYSLFGDSENCKKNSMLLYSTGLSVLILNWVYFVFSFIRCLTKL